jgi:hypothetical protein
LLGTKGLFSTSDWSAVVGEGEGENTAAAIGEEVSVVNGWLRAKTRALERPRGTRVSTNWDPHVLT